MNRTVTQERLNDLCRSFEASAALQALDLLGDGRHAYDSLLQAREALEEMGAALAAMTTEIVEAVEPMLSSKDDREDLDEIVRDITERGDVDALVCRIARAVDTWTQDDLIRLYAALSFRAELDA